MSDFKEWFIRDIDSMGKAKKAKKAKEKKEKKKTKKRGGSGGGVKGEGAKTTAEEAAEAAEEAAEAAEEEAEKKRDEEEAEREQREKREHQQHQVSRLHTILKPFMLRRVKTDVMHEMPDKVEIQLKCQLTSRQRALYKRLRKKLSLADLLTSKTLNKKQSDKNMEHLMNMVMQFRKVCNHPEIFEVRRKEESGTVLALCVHCMVCVLV